MFCFVSSHLISCVQGNIWKCFLLQFIFQKLPGILYFLISFGRSSVDLITTPGVDTLTIPIFQIRKEVFLWL